MNRNSILILYVSRKEGKLNVLMLTVSLFLKFVEWAFVFIIGTALTEEHEFEMGLWDVFVFLF